MEARYRFVEKLKEEVNQRLHGLIKDEAKYQDFLEKLIVQVFAA